MRKHRVILAVLLVALMLLPSLAVVVNAQDEITLRWRTRPDNQAEIDVYTAASTSIDEAWDGVTLAYEPGGSETSSYQDVLIAEIEAGTAPDVFWIPGADVARFAQFGLILNLAEVAGADEDFNAEDFVAGPMGFLTTSVEDGVDTLWGLPRDVSAFAIYYNADLFDEAGLDYPGEGDTWTWEDLTTAATEIRGLGDEIYGYGMNSWWANWGYWVNSAGSSFFNEDNTACGLNNPETVLGLEAALNLYTTDVATPWGTDTEGPFLAGTVGMYVNGRWGTPGTIANADFNWDVAPLPEGPGGSSNWIFWGAYVVNVNTEHPAEAWDLVTRLTSAEIQGQIASLGANIPSRTTADAQELFLATLPEAEINNQAFLDGIAVGRTETPLFNGDWPAVDTAYGNAVNSIFNGELTPQEFADTICSEVEQYFDAQ